MRICSLFSSRRLLMAVWLAWVASVGWNWLVFRFSILHPPWQPIALLLSIQLFAACGLAIRCCRRIWQRLEQRRALAALLLGITPLWLWAALVSYVSSTAGVGYIPFNVLTAQGIGFGASIGGLEIRLRYPQRAEGERAVMFHRGWPATHDQLAAIDRHLARIERVLGRPSRGKAHWVRGHLWGRSNYYFQGLAISDAAEPPLNSPDGLTTIDRHELAHFAIEQLCDHTHRPPFLLVEGWAESQSGYMPGYLARQAMHARECGADLSLAELTGNDWYCRDLDPVYTHGGALVDYLLRKYGGPKFLELYTTCRPQTFAADVRRVLGIDLTQLDGDYWTDVLEQCPSWHVRLERALERLPLAEGVDDETYRSFAHRFPAACARCDSAQNGVCEVTIVQEAHDEQQPPQRNVQRMEVIHAGAQQGVISDSPFAEEVVVAGPHESFRLRRKKSQNAWSNLTAGFPALTTLRCREDIAERRGTWEQIPRAFSDKELIELENAEWQVSGCQRVIRQQQEIVEITLSRIAPILGKENERCCRFLAERGWLFDGASCVRFGPDRTAIRQESQMTYEFPSAAAPVQVSARFTSIDHGSGRLLRMTEHRFVRRALDERTRRSLQLASYWVAPESVFSASLAAWSVTITWAGATLSLLLGTALRIWEAIDKRRAA